VRENNSTGTEVCEGGGGGAQGARADAPAACGDHAEAGCPSAAHGGLTLEQISTCSPWRTPHRSRWIPEGDCDPMEGPHWRRVLEGFVDPRREEPTLEAGEEREEECTTEATCDELTITLIPPPPVWLRGRRLRTSGVKFSPGRREGWMEGVIRVSFISHYPTHI